MPRRQNGSITRLADGRWMVRITIPATATAPARRPHRITESKNRKEAERLLRELQAEAEVAGADAAEIYKPRAATTLAEYVSGRYAASLDADVAASRLRARTAEEYLSVLKLRVLPLYGHRMVSSLTAADADVLAERVRSKGLSLNTVRRAVECFRRLIKLAEKDAIVPRGTTAMIELPPAKVMQEPKRITPEEARRLLAVLLTDAAKGEPRALTALLATYGGLRTSEALGVRWASVDLAAATAQIVEGITELRDGRLVVGDPKTRLSTPTLHLPPPLVAVLRDARRARSFSTWVGEAKPGTPPRPSYYTALLARVLQGRWPGRHGRPRASPRLRRRGPGRRLGPAGCEPRLGALGRAAVVADLRGPPTQHVLDAGKAVGNLYAPEPAAEHDAG